MTKTPPNNVVPIKGTPAKQKSSTERIWGKQVVSHGYAGIPSLLFRNQGRLGLSPMQMNIIVQLLDYWFDEARPPFPSKAVLAARMGVDKKTIQRNVKALETAGYLKREQKKTAAGDWGSNTYHLNGLVEKIKSLEPEFAKVRNEKQAMDAVAETPIGKRETKGIIAT